ncbi:MAG: hypothetical protein ACI9EQ_001865 [Bacteroidia bacterium]|jgi:hypothetical protein
MKKIATDNQPLIDFELTRKRWLCIKSGCATGTPTMQIGHEAFTASLPAGRQVHQGLQFLLSGEPKVSVANGRRC